MTWCGSENNTTWRLFLRRFAIRQNITGLEARLTNNATCSTAHMHYNSPLLCLLWSRIVLPPILPIHWIKSWITRLKFGPYYPPYSFRTKSHFFQRIRGLREQLHTTTTNQPQHLPTTDNILYWFDILNYPKPWRNARPSKSATLTLKWVTRYVWKKITRCVWLSIWFVFFAISYPSETYICCQPFQLYVLNEYITPQ